MTAASGGSQKAFYYRFTTFGENMASRCICSFFCSDEIPSESVFSVDFFRILSDYSDYFNEGGVVNENEGTDQ